MAKTIKAATAVKPTKAVKTKTAPKATKAVKTGKVAKSTATVKAAGAIKPAKRGKRAADVDRLFEMAAEDLPERWKDKLEIFFEETEAGIHDHWHLRSTEVGSIDVFHTFGPYDITNLVEGNIKVFLKGRAIKVREKEHKVFKIEEGYIISPAVYENVECFRYALPAESEAAS